VRLAYLFSRFPVISQTFCVTEILGLEQKSVSIEIASINPPNTTLRHAALTRLQAPVFYAPPTMVLKELEKRARESKRWPSELIEEHEQNFGASFKSGIRARNALYFAQLFESRGIKHVHVHFANRATHTALFIKRIAKIPFSFTAHAQDFLLDLGSDELLGELCREAAFVVAVSDWSADVLRQKFPDCANKIHRIYNGFDLRQLAPSGAGSPSKVPVILSVGRLIEFKGFDVLIDACAELQRAGVEFECRIIGDGPLRAALDEKIREAGLNGSVSLLGSQPLERIFCEMRDARVFALASLIDSKGACDVLPTVISEAMAHGLPVVSTRVAGIPEMIVDGTTGWLAEPHDPVAFAAALKTALVQEEGSRDRMARAARDRAVELFDLGKTSQRLLELFEEHVEHAHVAPPGASRTLLLVDSWVSEPELLLPVLEANPTSHLLCRRVGQESGKLPDPMPEFLPDAFALEGYWMQNASLRSELEALFDTAPSGPDAHDYLEQARAACWILGTRMFDGVERVHAWGWRSLLLAWILRRSLKFDLTATIEDKVPWGSVALREMAWSTIAIWTPNKALAEKCGAPLTWFDPRKPNKLAEAISKSLRFP
jgi:glycosyltransferase involved in cell wall biosynthesis